MKKILKSDVRIRIIVSTKELEIIEKRKKFVTLRNEMIKAKNDYIEVKSDFYKLRIIKGQKL